MNPIGSSSAYNARASSAQPVQGTHTALDTPLAGHVYSLTSARMSDHTVNALNAIEAQGDERATTLAKLTKEAIGRGLLQLSPNQQVNGTAQFGMSCNQEVLVVRAKLNERSEYDVLGIGFRKGSETPVSMTLPSPSAAVLSTVLPPSTLLGLPNELLLLIAGSTGRRGTGINTSLRAVNKQMKDIADHQMSPKQRFVTENQQSLRGAGYSRYALDALLNCTVAQQNFALAHGPVLHASAGYHGNAINALAILPAAQQNFVLMNAQTLHVTCGYDPGAINVLARLPLAQQNFSLINGPVLHTTAGFDGYAINELATKAPAHRNFALANGPTLRATAGYNARAITVLAMLTPAEQNFALTNGPRLHITGGYNGHDINRLAALQRSN